jgi:hypothetical protein
MTLMKLIKFAAAALLALSSLSASAALISIVDSGSSEYQPNIATPANNNFTQAGIVTPSQYTIAGSLQANAKLKVTYYYLGKEANWTNLFAVPGSVEAPLGGSSGASLNKGSITTIVEKDSLFDFVFYSPLKGAEYSVSNAEGPNGAPANAGDYDAILFLDDTAGFLDGVPDDDNHDDLLIGVRVTAVPEPTTLLLMSMGLLGLFGARRLKA